MVHEPNHKDRPTEQRCDKCHEVLKFVKLTSEKDPFCHHCGHVLGHCIQPSSWVCGACGDVILCHGGNMRPGCIHCGLPMNALSAQPSRIHGVGTGDAELDCGFELLCEAQKVLKLDIRPILEKHEADLDLGSEILRDSQS